MISNLRSISPSYFCSYSFPEWIFQFKLKNLPSLYWIPIGIPMLLSHWVLPHEIYFPCCFRSMISPTLQTKNGKVVDFVTKHSTMQIFLQYPSLSLQIYWEHQGEISFLLLRNHYISTWMSYIFLRSLLQMHQWVSIRCNDQNDIQWYIWRMQRKKSSCILSLYRYETIWGFYAWSN